MSEPLLNTIVVLEQARFLVYVGWCQDHYNTFDGQHLSFCATGAIRHARAMHDQPFGLPDDPAQRALSYTIWGNVVRWNDRVERTKREVLDAFDVTIERLERVRKAGL